MGLMLLFYFSRLQLRLVYNAHRTLRWKKVSIAYAGNDVLLNGIIIASRRAKNASSGICEQRRPRSACASAQADQGLRRPLKKSLAIIECINGEQMLE